ncbi:MAG TPA: hypothetical protein VF903_11145 [Nitrospirota bacterium]
MLEFKIGDRVTFKPGDPPEISGVLTKYNKKTVTVITDNGEHWNVAPGLLKLAKDVKASDDKQSKRDSDAEAVRSRDQWQPRWARWPLNCFEGKIVEEKDIEFQ